MVLVFQHVPYEGPGLIGDILEGRGVPFRIIETWDDAAFPLSPAGATGVISMGGPMSANDHLPALEKEKAFLAECLQRRLPMLGVCLGAQLIASVLGAAVYAGREPEVGWGEVSLSAEGMADPVLGGVADHLPVLHWHGETFDLPEGAVRLASSQVCDNQAFRYGHNVYGLQFHLEATAEMVRDWLDEDDPRDGLVVDEALVTVDMDRWVHQTQFWGSLIIGRFIDRMLRHPNGDLSTDGD